MTKQAPAPRALELRMVSNGAAMIFENSARIAQFDREEDALLFISAALPGTERGMNAEFKRWVMMEGLEFIDAEELFHEVAAVEAHSKAEVEDQSRRMNWLGEFITRWEGVSRAKGEAFWNAPVVSGVVILGDDKPPLTLNQYEAEAVKVMEARFAKEGARFATPEWMDAMRDCPLAEPEFFERALILSHGQKVVDGEVVWADEADVAAARKMEEADAAAAAVKMAKRFDARDCADRADAGL